MQRETFASNIFCYQYVMKYRARVLTSQRKNDITASYRRSESINATTITMGFKKALKALEILEKPEVIFNRRLQSNPYYPFKRVERNSK